LRAFAEDADQPRASADVVVSILALHSLDDLATVLSSLERWLVDDGLESIAGSGRRPVLVRLNDGTRSSQRLVASGVQAGAPESSSQFAAGRTR